jgi:HAMP domain-containing protein
MMNALFKPGAPKPATQLDRTTAAARDIVDTAARLRAEKTERLRALRQEHEAQDPQATEKPPSKRQP